LALHRLRRSLEQRAARITTAGAPSVVVVRDDLASALEELIAALDRRIPHLEREGEAAIVRDAALLRARAVSRLTELAGGPTAAPSASDPASTEGGRR
jgi:hypothetical protein